MGGDQKRLWVLQCLGNILFLKMSTQAFILYTFFWDSERFLFKILELEALSFYLSGMPAGGSGTRDSTDGLWRLGGMQSKWSAQEDRGQRREEGFWAQRQDLRPQGCRFI